MTPSVFIERTDAAAGVKDLPGRRRRGGTAISARAHTRPLVHRITPIPVAIRVERNLAGYSSTCRRRRNRAVCEKLVASAGAISRPDLVEGDIAALCKDNYGRCC